MRKIHWAVGVCLVSGVFSVRDVKGAAGDVVATFNFGAARFLQDPTRPVMYATDSQNSVKVINEQNWTVQSIPVGAGPWGMTLSPDASKLYVADAGTTSIGVIDTHTLSVLSPIAVPTVSGISDPEPVDLAFGTNNKLYVLTFGGIEQINATTGASTGPGLRNQGGGTLRIAPDGKSLFFGNLAISPSTLEKIDVSTGTPTVTITKNFGSHGYDVSLSHNGVIVAQPDATVGSLPLLRSSDLGTLGTLDTGSGPTAMAFSPDDAIAYVTYSPLFSDTITAYSTSTFAPVGSNIIAGFQENLTEMSVDSSGRYLFASTGQFATNKTTVIYDTGQSVPEPGSVSLAALAGGFMVLRRGKRKS